MNRRIWRRIQRLIKTIVSFRRSLWLRVATSLIGSGARMRRPSVTIFGLLMGTRRARGHAGSRFLSGGPRTNVVAFKNAGLVSDLDSAFIDDPMVRLRFISGGLWKTIGERFLDGPLLDFGQLQHRGQHPGPHEALIAFLRRVVPVYLRILRSESLIVGNFTYWMVHDIAAALEGSGQRLVVVHKEGLVSAWPSVAADYANKVTAGVGSTTANRVSVHSTATKELIARCGIVPADRIIVTGAIRLDSCHRSRRRLSGEPPQRFHRITFFTFWPTVGIRLGLDSPDRSGAVRHPDWSRTLEMTLRVAEQLAANRPDVEVVIKSKGWVSRLPDIAEMLEQLADTGHSNLLVHSEGEGQQLLLASDAIVAFNSTVILEAIAAGTPTFVPGFEFKENPDYRQYDLDLAGTVRYASSPEELRAQLETILDGPPTKRRAALTSEELSVLERYAGNADGAATERLATFLGTRRHNGGES